MASDFDAVVIGSGFGGSVMACRLAEAGLRVCLLELGRRYPPGSFPRSPRELARSFWAPGRGLYGLYDVWSFPGLKTVVSSGLGGGSLIFANVLLRKDEKWFVKERPGRDGYEYWPVTRQELDGHYDRVEQMLGAQRYPLDQAPYRHTPKTLALRQAAERLGLDWQLPPLAVTFANQGRPAVPGEPIDTPEPNLHGAGRSTCRLVGECDIGCNFGSKNSLDYTYLSAAWRAGADIRDRCEVRSLALAGAGFSVSYLRYELPGDAEPIAAPSASLTLTTDRLIFSAGALGTPRLLLRNRSAFPHLSRALGTRFCGNGDFLALVLKARPGLSGNGGGEPDSLDPSFGPVITSAIRLPDRADGGGGPGTGRGFYIEDAGYPEFIRWLADDNPLADARRLLRFAVCRLRALASKDTATEAGWQLARLLGGGGLSDSSLVLLGMGRDVPNGRMRLQGGQLRVDWASRASRPYFHRVNATMRRLAHAMGGRYAGDPLYWVNQLVTVHPLGGAPMGRTEQEGVVDPAGQVFNYPGLYVADGSVMPGPVGTNPSLTIAALADRTADKIIDQWAAARTRGTARRRGEGNKK
jgi:cholesterol oxidase